MAPLNESLVDTYSRISKWIDSPSAPDDRYDSEQFPKLSRVLRSELSFVVAGRAGFETALSMVQGRISFDAKPERRYVDCPWKCKCDPVQDSRLAEHLRNQCVKRIVKCRLDCGEDIVAEDLQEHLLSPGLSKKMHDQVFSSKIRFSTSFSSCGVKG